MSITPDEISRIQRYEGDPRTHQPLLHLYRDSVHGKVTIGYGHVIPNIASAQNLLFKFSIGGSVATAADILKEWNTIMSKPFGQQYSAAYYAPFCNLTLQQADTTKLLTNDLATTESQLMARFPGYAQFAQPGQAGLIDMGYNLGVAALISGYPSFVAAVRKKDWAIAAKECNRPQVDPARNTEVMQLFQLAATLQPLPAPTHPIPPHPHPGTGHTGSTGTIIPPPAIPASYYIGQPAPAQMPASVGVPGLPAYTYGNNYDCQGIVAIVAMQSNVTTAAITAIAAIATEKK